MQLRCVFAVACVLMGSPAAACTISISTPGSLALSADGKSLSSTNSGGIASVIVISDLTLSLWTTITISNTRLETAPTGFVEPVTFAASYSATWPLGSASGTLTNNPAFSVFLLQNLAITITLHNTVTSNTGFRHGNYKTRTTVQCS